MLFQQLKRFFKHSAIYAGGNVLHRGAMIILLPFYTHYLTPADYGVLSLFYVTATFVRAILSMGIAHATLRFYYEYDTEPERKKVISTAFVSSFGIGLAGILLLFPFLGHASQALFQTTAYIKLFQITLITLCLDMSMEIARAFIRAKERPVLFVVTSVVQLLAQVGFNIYTVVVLEKGVEGILWGNLASVSLVWIILVSLTLRYSGVQCDMQKLKAILRYCVPLVPASILVMLVTTVDRYFLTQFSTLARIGLYSLALNFGMLVRVVLIDPFGYSFGPYRFSIMKQPNAKEIYSKILTYYTAVLCFLGLVISVFAKETVHLISAPEFIEAHRVVPWVALMIILQGPVYVLQTGIYLTKKTKHILHVSILKSIVLFALMMVLVPRLDIYGAIAAKAVTALVSIAATYVLSQRVYPIVFEWRRMFAALGLCFGMYVLSLGVETQTLVWNIVLKSLWILTFPLWLGLIGFYHPAERRAFLQMLRGKFINKLQAVSS